MPAEFMASLNLMCLPNSTQLTFCIFRLMYPLHSQLAPTLQFPKYHNVVTAAKRSNWQCTASNTPNEPCFGHHVKLRTALVEVTRLVGKALFPPLTVCGLQLLLKEGQS